MARSSRTKPHVEGCLRPEDLPLGPWAGARLVAWATKTGTVWHADPECGQLKNRGQETTLAQPASGTLADRRLPERLHCNPPGEITAYQASAEALIDFDRTTQSAVERLAKGRLDLPVAAARHASRVLERRLRDHQELSPHGQRCAADRRSLLAELDEEIHNRLPVMLAAGWVAAGRTPRQHQDRYEAFVEAAEEACARHEVSASWGVAGYVNSRCLPTWLNRVAEGELPEAATADLTAGEVRRTRTFAKDTDDDFYARLNSAWRETGQAWQRMLEGIVLAHPGKILAIFDEHQPGLSWNLRALFGAVVPCATLRAADFDWICGQVPAVLRLLFRDDDRRRHGLVLDEDRAYRFDVEQCALLLSNLVISLGVPELAARVMPRTGDAHAGVSNDDRARPAKSQLPERFHGFGSGPRTRALTVEVVAPAFRAAAEGLELTSPGPGRHSQESATL
jgi:hypothetical protein